MIVAPRPPPGPPTLLVGFMVSLAGVHGASRALKHGCCCSAKRSYNFSFHLLAPFRFGGSSRVSTKAPSEPGKGKASRRMALGVEKQLLFASLLTPSPWFLMML